MGRSQSRHLLLCNDPTFERRCHSCGSRDWHVYEDGSYECATCEAVEAERPWHQCPNPQCNGKLRVRQGKLTVGSAMVQVRMCPKCRTTVTAAGIVVVTAYREDVMAYHRGFGAETTMRRLLSPTDPLGRRFFPRPR